MIRAMRSTLLMLASRAYLLAGLGSVAGFTFVSVLLTVSDATDVVDDRGPLGETVTLTDLAAPQGLAQTLTTSITLVGVVMLAVHATAMASDYPSGVIRNLLVRQPNRTRLLIGKSLGLVIGTIAATAIVIAVGTITALAFAPAEVDTGNWFTTEGLAALARSSGNLLLAALAWGILGQVLAVVTRSAVVSLAIGASLAIPLDIVVSAASTSAKAWLPGQLLQSISRGGTSDVAYDQALLTVSIATAAAAIAAAWLFQRRDITA